MRKENSIKNSMNQPLWFINHKPNNALSLWLTKSNNLQYYTLVYGADGTNDSSTKRLTFQAFFFIISYRLRALKTPYCHFCKSSIYEKNNTWNIRRLVDNSFVPSAQQTSVLYCRLTDFKPSNGIENPSYYMGHIATKVVDTLAQYF